MPSARKLLPLLLPALLTLPASAAVHYVDLNSPNPTPPYTNWATAATNIQDAVDAAVAFDTILVTNGTYRTGGRTYFGSITNRVTLTLRLTLQSVNGPGVTLIEGYQVPGTTNGNSAVRCVYVSTFGITVAGFTLTNGATGLYDQGGGVFCYGSVVSNCFLVNNSASGYGGGAYSPPDGYEGAFVNCVFRGNSAGASGGGAYQGMLSGCLMTSNSANGGGGASLATCSNCTFIGNSALYGGGAYQSILDKCSLIGNSGSLWPPPSSGGGAYQGTLKNCLIIHNSAYYGGGTYFSYLTNCTVVSNSATYGGGFWPVLPASSSPSILNSIIFFNTASNGPNWYGAGNVSYCCTTPDIPPASHALFTITNAPPLFDQNAGSFRLQSNSPCINSGNNSYTTDGTDFDGNPRISGGTVDIGAYEFQSPSSVLSYAWAQQYGLPTDGSADFTDSDGDGLNNWREWVAGTDPTNSASLLKMFSPSNSTPGLKVSWQSVSNRTYFLQRGTNLSQLGLTALQSNITGQAGTTIYNDVAATNSGPYFYRVGVQ